MGRPEDQFCKDNVEKLEKNGRWKCKHCSKEFSGAASRIRNHLSGRGNDIGSCEKVPPHIRDEASKKRGRNSSPGEVNDDNVWSSNGTNNRNKGSDQDTTDVLVKFLMSRNLPVNLFKDSDFRTFIRSVAQHGVPSCLFRDDSVGIQKSVSNFEQEVNEYMVMVKESWKTTGCTLIYYHLDQGKGNPSGLDHISNNVFGFYCPKGFIFVEDRRLDKTKGIEAALKNHVLNLPIEDVTHLICHSSDHPRCGMAHREEEVIICDGLYDNTCASLVHGSGSEFVFRHKTKSILGLHDMTCVRDQINQFWVRICRDEEDAEKSGWVHNLIQKSERLYHELFYSYFYKEWREDMVEKDADDDMFSSSFERLRSIMHLQDRFKALLVGNGLPDDLRLIINNKEFWSNGKQLLDALTPLMGIIDLMDTIVPTSGYLQLAIDNAECSLKSYYDREVSKYQHIWDWFNDSFDEDEIEVAAYMSPASFGRRGKEEYLDSTDPGVILTYLVPSEETQQLDAELEVYRSNNPFANLDQSERKYNHPVKLWKKYGDKFPVLMKYAIKVLSQPASCMCNQVKKQISRIQQTDNFILRLNYNMMQEFTKLGDDIYKPFNPRGSCYTLPWWYIAPSYAGDIPVFMHKSVEDYVNVVGDGNCGFRAIAHALGYGQDRWGLVRNEMREHVENNIILYSNLYKDDFNTLSNVEKLKEAIEWLSGPAPLHKWFSGWDMGHVVATTFQLVFVIHNIHQSTTFIPLKSTTFIPLKYDIGDINKEIHVGFLHNENHYIWLGMQYNCPLPPVARGRMPVDTIQVTGVQTRYSERMSRWMDLHNKEAPVQGSPILIPSSDA